MSAAKKQIRHFDSLSTPPVHQPNSATQLNAEADPHPQATSRWGMFFSVTGAHPLPVERLLLRTINAELGVPGAVADPHAIAVRNVLLPSWRLKLAVPLLARQYKRFVESPAFGVPGLLTYVDARTRWVDSHISAAWQDGAAQVVILGAGYDTRALRLAASMPSLVFFEVDSSEIITKKKALLAELPPQPVTATETRLISLDWGNTSALIPALTAAGFQPATRCVIVLEGLLPHMTQEQANAVLEDTAALCAPGSRILFDFLHADAFNGSNRALAGYDTLAAACANKGAPFLSGQTPGFSAWVKATQRMHLRITELLRPEDVASKLVRPAYELAASAKTQPGEGNAAASEGTWHCVACAAGGGSTNPPTLPLPQFYSLISATKAVPRLSLKDAVEFSLPLPGHHPTSADNGSGSGALSGRRDAEEAALGPGDGPAGGCIFRGFAAMRGIVWGRDTDDEEGDAAAVARSSPAPWPVRPPPARMIPVIKEPPSAAASSSSAPLGKQQSAEWSLAVARAGAASSSAAAGCSHREAGPSSHSLPSVLEHAVSLPTSTSAALAPTGPPTGTTPASAALPSLSSALEHALSLPSSIPGQAMKPPERAKSGSWMTWLSGE